jgi:hypothetical protein
MASHLLPLDPCINPFCFSYFLGKISCFFALAGKETRNLTGSAQKVGEGSRRREEVAQTMYTHVSKYKNDKIKERKRNKNTCWSKNYILL